MADASAFLYASVLISPCHYSAIAFPTDSSLTKYHTQLKAKSTNPITYFDQLMQSPLGVIC